MIKERTPIKGQLVIDFDYEDPSHHKEIKKLFTANDWSMVVWDLDQHLSDLLNHHGHEMKDGAFEQVEKLQDFLRDCMREHGLDFINYF